MVFKYRSRPVTIEALRFDGLNHDEVADFCAPGPVKVAGGLKLIIPTLEGDMTASKGDFVVKGLKGEFYPVKPDIFDLKYERL